jgi:hypothetical protein
MKRRVRAASAPLLRHPFFCGDVSGGAAEFHTAKLVGVQLALPAGRFASSSAEGSVTL